MDLKSWKKLERYRAALAIGWLFLLLAWGAVQYYLGDTKAPMDWVFTLTFAPAFVACVLVGGHYQDEDLLNSMGLGQRAKLRYSA